MVRSGHACEWSQLVDRLAKRAGAEGDGEFLADVFDIGSFDAMMAPGDAAVAEGEGARRILIEECDQLSSAEFMGLGQTPSKKHIEETEFTDVERF